MTLLLSLPPDLEQKLKDEANRQGVAPDEYARRVVQQHLEARRAPAQSMQELFAQWEAEDATDDPTELARREQEWVELKKSFNENHYSNRKLFP
jgi:hypothetical protein